MYFQLFMKVFELYFNPELEKKVIFESFCYEPENAYEKRQGSLFMLGELNNVTEKNQRFLKNLARVLKTRFYGSKSLFPEKSLKQSLKTANLFLQDITQKGDVTWISHLNFAILALTSTSIKTKNGEIEKYKLNFTKVGNIKILLLRDGEVLDIGQNLEFKEIEPYPVKVFSNVVNGKLEKDDKILILTENLSQDFEENDIIEKIANLTSVNEKTFNGIFKDAQKQGSGACILISLKNEESARLVTSKSLKKLIFKEKVFKNNLIGVLSSKIYKILKTKAKPKEIEMPSSFVETKFTGSKKYINRFFEKLLSIKTFIKNRNIALIGALALLLCFGGLYAKIEENKRISSVKIFLSEIEQKVNSVNNLLLLKKEDQANTALLGIWNDIQKLAENKSPLQAQINSQKKEIEQLLFGLNKLEIIQEPELISQINDQNFASQKINIFNKKIYVFNPYLKNIYKLDLEKSDKEFTKIETENVFVNTILINNSILFIQRSGEALVLKNNGLENVFLLKKPYNDFAFANVAVFNNGLYFLDSQKGEIIKYRYIKSFKWAEPEIWLKPDQEKVENTKSIAIDGSIWILNKNNSISRHYEGRFEQKLELEIFPVDKEFIKILSPAGSKYIYILDVIQKRIIILNKQGKILKQYQSEKFDNLKDFLITQNEKQIYILNNNSIFLIDIN